MNTVPMTSPSGHGDWSELVVGPRVWSLARAVVFDHHGAMGHDVVGTLLATAEQTSLAANDPGANAVALPWLRHVQASAVSEAGFVAACAPDSQCVWIVGCG